MNENPIADLSLVRPGSPRDHDPMCPAANDRFRPLLHVCTCKALREPAAAYGCNPADGHHWVSQLSQEHIWVQTCSTCFQIRLDLDDHDAQVRADERERIVAELDGPARESEAMYAHACEQRDVARAEAESWKRVAKVAQNDLDDSASSAVRWYDDLQEARAEVAELREGWGGYADYEIAKVLEVLRTKVQAVRVVESRVKGRRVTVLVDRADVLALFDGASNG